MFHRRHRHRKRRVDGRLIAASAPVPYRPCERGQLLDVIDPLARNEFADRSPVGILVNGKRPVNTGAIEFQFPAYDVAYL